MEGKPLSPEILKALEEAIDKVRPGKYDIPLKARSFDEEKVIIDDRPWANVLEKNLLDEPFEKKFITKELPTEPPLRGSFNHNSPKNSNREIIKKFLDSLPDLAEFLKLTPEQRAVRARERGEALAEACHAGTAQPTIVLRPLSLRRGFISL